MKKTTLLFFLISPLILSAQEIPVNPNLTDTASLRQGIWTYWLDGNGNITDKKENLQYYRIIEFKDDKPVGVTKDYYYPSAKLYQELALTFYGKRGVLWDVD